MKGSLVRVPLDIEPEVEKALNEIKKEEGITKQFIMREAIDKHPLVIKYLKPVS